MKIDKAKCIGCEQCLPYCPVGAIRMTDKQTGKFNPEILKLRAPHFYGQGD